MSWIAVAAVVGAGASVYSATQAGRGGGGDAPPAPQLDPRGEEFQAELYPRITSGLQGLGLTPDIDARTRSRQLGALQREYPEAERSLRSNIERAIPRADVGVRSYLDRALKAQFARQKETLGREGEFRGFEDKAMAQSLAFGALGGEKRMAVDITSAFNQSALRRAQAPDFSSELFGGLGGAAGIALAGPIGYANQFSSQR